MPSGSEPVPGAFSRAVTAEFRAIMGRYDISATQLAGLIERSPSYVSKRFRFEASFTANDIADICDALRVDLLELLVAAVRASRRL